MKKRKKKQSAKEVRVRKGEEGRVNWHTVNTGVTTGVAEHHYSGAEHNTDRVSIHRRSHRKDNKCMHKHTPSRTRL